MAHRCTTPQSWFMVPVAVLKHKYEAKRLEKKLIRQLKPRLNMEEKSSWRQGDTAHNYKFQEKVSKRAERNALRSKRLTIGLRLRGGTTDTETNSNTNQWRNRITQPHRESVMSRFWIPGQPCVYDCGILLREAEDGKPGEEITITYELGSYEATRWRYLKQRYRETPM